VDGPLTGSNCAQAIEGETDAFADAHARVAEKKQRIAGQVIAPPQFLLNELVLLLSQWAWQTMLLTGDIVATKQMGKERTLLSPG
jgi:hypothetical protein